ncbi:hypothetical protein NDU88_005108, partial [Pleurodeles waltl]
WGNSRGSSELVLISRDAEGAGGSHPGWQSPTPLTARGVRYRGLCQTVEGGVCERVGEALP